ncbi:MAG: aminotransferase class V-fold PLP-dependent enzyme [Bacteroidota bacterium]
MRTITYGRIFLPKVAGFKRFSTSLPFGGMLSILKIMTVDGLLDSGRLEAARALFPHTKEGMVYLNHAATGPLSTRVISAINQHLQARSLGPIDTYARDIEEVAGCRANIRKLINAESPERVSLVASTSDSLNIVASGFPWKSGDRVLLNELEFPANVYPYLALKRHGVELDILSSKDGRITPDMVERGITPRTRLVAISAVQFLSGFRADLASIGDLCRRRGIMFIVDGIQAVGGVRIDVQRMKIDALGAGAQKWQLGPHGIGFLYLTEQLQSMVQQQFVGWLSVDNPWDFHNYRQPLAAAARRYEGGSLNFPGIWGLNAAMSVLLEFGVDAIEHHVLGLTKFLIERSRALEGFTLYSPDGDSERAGIVTLQPRRAMDLTGVVKALLEQRVTISLREGKFRFSPHFYNTPEEIDLAVSALADCLASVPG